MPHIKKLRVSFDVDMEVLLKAIAVGNSGFNIEAYQQATEQAQVIEGSPLLLPPGATQTVCLRELVLDRLRYTGKPTKVADMKDLAKNNGYKVSSLYTVIHVLYTSRLVARTKPGTYKITKRGMA